MTSEYETLFGPSRLRHGAEMADAFIAAKQQASRDVYGLLSQEMRERGVLPERLSEELPGQITPINLRKHHVFRSADELMKCHM